MARHLVLGGSLSDWGSAPWSRLQNMSYVAEVVARPFFRPLQLHARQADEQSGSRLRLLQTEEETT